MRRLQISVPKAVGTAVVRNRARRRVREALRELTRDGQVLVSDGFYRVGVSNSLENLSPAALRASMVKLFAEVKQ